MICAKFSQTWIGGSREKVNNVKRTDGHRKTVYQIILLEPSVQFK